MKHSVTLLALLSVSVPSWAVHLSDTSPTYREGEVIVKYRDTAGASAAATLKQQMGLSAVKPLMSGRAELLKLPSAMDVRGALRALRDDPSVEYAQPNFIKRATAVVPPNDPLFNDQWGLNNTGQANFVQGGQSGTVGGDLNMLAAWDPAGNGSFTRTGRSTVTVAVLDDGFQTSHPDLAANFQPGVNFLSGGGTNSDVSPAGSHGTEVAGCLGAIGNNSLGVAGAIWHVNILPMKFTFDTATEVAALNYADTHGVTIINGSFGGPVYDQTELTTLGQLAADGVLFVNSAGNENSNTDIAGANYPAGYGLSNVLAVAATNRQDNIASFSTYGPTTIPVAAPGLQIVTTTTGSAYTTSPGVNGTSFSSPYAAGVAALIKDYLGADTLEIKSRLIESADAGLGDIRPANELVAGGRINAANALALTTRPSLTIKPVAINNSLGATPGVPLLAPAIVPTDTSHYPMLTAGTSTDLQIAVQNLWQAATGVTGTLTADNAGITVNTGSVSFGSIAQGGTANGTFNISVASNLSGHQYIGFTLNLAATGGYSASRHFTLELGTLSNNVTVSQPIGTTLYDNFHTWKFTLAPGDLQPGQNTLTFKAYAQANDVDIIVGYEAPPQYSIDLNACDPNTGACDPSALYYFNVPGSRVGAGYFAGATEYVNWGNPQPGTYYVTVVNFNQSSSTVTGLGYQLTAYTNTGGIGGFPSSTAQANAALNSGGGGGAFGMGTLAGLALIPLLGRGARRRNRRNGEEGAI